MKRESFFPCAMALNREQALEALDSSFQSYGFRSTPPGLRHIFSRFSRETNESAYLAFCGSETKLAKASSGESRSRPTYNLNVSKRSFGRSWKKMSGITTIHGVLRHPHRLSVFWKKGKAKCSTKPVPWQGGIKNHFRGVHVWPEPDPVQTKLTLLKNTEDKLVQYQDKKWNIFIQNVSHSGKRKLLATGCIDINDYITEEPRKSEVTVTLKPKNKHVLSGVIEFELSSVMLEDGLPRRTNEEIMKEMMDDAREELARNKSARKARSSRSVKTKPSEKAMNSCRDSSSGTTGCNDTPVSDTAAEEENKNEAVVGGVRQCDGPQVDPSCSNNTRPGPRKVRRKAPPPPRPAPPQSRPSQPHPPGSQGLPQDSQETAAACCEKPLYKTEKAGSGNYPEEFNPFGEVDERQDSLSLGSVGTVCKETPVQDVQPGEMSSTEKEGLIDHKGPSPCDETQTPDPTAHTEPIPKMEKPSSTVSHHHALELAKFVQEELQLVQDNMFSLEKVTFKIELEMLKASKTKECEEEWSSLSQDWLTLNTFHSELVRRKEDLQTLGRQEKITECVNLLRNELKLLLEVEGWQKTEEHRAREETVLNLIVKLSEQSSHA